MRDYVLFEYYLRDRVKGRLTLRYSRRVTAALMYLVPIRDGPGYPRALVSALPRKPARGNK